MGPGKAASQLGHSYKLITKLNLEQHSALFSEYLNDGMGTNVCLVAPNLGVMEELYHQCLYMSIPVVKIADSGHIYPPHFLGQPIVTALGIGPCHKENQPKLLSKLKLYGEQS